MTLKTVKKVFRLTAIWLMIGHFLFGLPIEAVLQWRQQNNIVDTLYHAQRSGRVVDKALLQPVQNAQAAGATDAMMVYDTNTTVTVPKYRIWNGTAWGAETSASNFTGELRFLEVKYAPTRDEAIMVGLTATGEVQAQVFNGTSWGTVSVLGTVTNSVGSRETQSLYRGFDVEYEQTSGDAVVVLGDGTADPNYVVWNGTTWSGATNIDIPTTGIPNWIELASRPGSDELAFILIDSNTDTYGMRWDGSAWNNMGTAAVWDATAGVATRKCIDVAFETTTGDILFLWADGTATTHWTYRTYSGGVLSAATNLANANQGGIGQWVRLVANPTAASDEIMLGSLDAGADLNTARWSGTAWSAIDAEHSATTENVIDMNFDIVYETHASNPNVAWLNWGNSTTVSRKRWSGVAWAAATTSDDDTALVRMNAHPNSGAVFSLIYDDDTATNDDIREIRLTGGSSTWTASTSIWGGPVARRLGLFRMAVASQAYSASTEAMMVYDAQDITSTPKYRRWTGASWGTEQNASTVNGQIRHMAVKFAPTRDEGIMVTGGSTGLVQAQVWNGSGWGSPSTLATMNNANGSRDTQSLYRGFDIEYENVSGDAVVVTGDGTADPNYLVWNGTTWSGAVDINIPTTGRPNWIELASRPGSDEMAVLIQDQNIDTYGMRWDGSTWGNMGDAVAWDTTAAAAGRKVVDVAFEKTSGDIMFLWGDATATTHWTYRTYSSGVLAAVANLANANQGGVAQWVKLATNPTTGSDEIMLGSLDAGADLNTARWSGTAWSAMDAEHSAATEDVADMNFDIVYETHASNPNVAWLAYGDGATVSRKRWSGAAWAAATTAGDDTARIVLNAQPNSGAVFQAVYEDDTSATDDIDTYSITGGGSTWSTVSDVWTGPVRRNLASFLVDIGSERYIAASNPTFSLAGYRWYTDNDAENVTDAWGDTNIAESTAISQLPAQNTPPKTGDELRLRAALTVNTANLTASTQQFKLQYKEGTDSLCTTGSWTDVGAGGGGSVWRYATSGVGDGATLSGAKITTTDVLQVYAKSSPTTSNPNGASSGQDIEYDFHIQNNGANANTQYSFRVVESDGTVFDAYSVCPTLMTAPDTAQTMRHGKFFEGGSEKGFIWVQ